MIQIDNPILAIAFSQKDEFLQEENGDCEIVLHTVHNWGGHFFHKN